MADIRLSTIVKKTNGFLFGTGATATVSEGWRKDTFTIEPSTHKNRTMGNRDDYFHGMFISYEDGIYEVAEYQAGEKQDELWIYGEYRSLNGALRSMLKGNKRTPIKIW